jgi:hypothetical protein
MEKSLQLKELRKNIQHISMKIAALQSSPAITWTEVLTLKSLRRLRSSFSLQILKLSDEYKQVLRKA